MKKYIYDRSSYKYKVIAPGILGGIVLFISIAKIVINPQDYVWLAGFTVGLYTFWEVFVSLANPSEVIFDGDLIIFSSFGKQHSFNISEIKSFKVKEFFQAKKAFIRIDDPGFLKGRYWVNCRLFNDTDELFKRICNLEVQIEPNGLKAQARKNGEEALKKRKEAKQAKLYKNKRGK
ncbi:MAG: hypothetical protein WBO70_01245 [Erysipelotrichaceae bacterium]